MANYTVQILGSPTAQTVLGDKALGLNRLGASTGIADIPNPRAVLWNPRR